jgi:hypothetical protein
MYTIFMTLRQFFVGKAIGTFVVIGLALLVAGFFALNNYIYKEKQADPSEQSFEPYRATLSGEYGCLPHKDTRGPQTDECMGGIRTESGEYYAVDTNLMSQMHAPLEIGQYITGNGLVTPIERLSSDHWQKYEVEGIFSITDSLEVQ